MINSIGQLTPQDLRQRWATRHRRPINAVTIARELGISVCFASLAATKGGLQALLIPKLGGSFTIVIDPSPAPGLQTTLSRKTIHSLRAAHELGHTRFYQGDQPPHRHNEPDAAEEVSCNKYAADLMRGDDLPRVMILKLLATPITIKEQDDRAR